MFCSRVWSEDVDVLHSIGGKSINDFTDEEIKKAQKWACKFYKELGVKSPFFRAWFGDGTLVSFDIVSHKKRSVVLQALYMGSADYQKKLPKPC